jgi:hypothetical protein
VGAADSVGIGVGSVVEDGSCVGGEVGAVVAAGGGTVGEAAAAGAEVGATAGDPEQATNARAVKSRAIRRPTVFLFIPPRRFVES